MITPRDLYPYWLLLLAVRSFLVKYDTFLDTRTDEANKACNTAVERLRDAVYNFDNDLI